MWLSMVVLQLEDPLGTIHEEKEFFPGFRFLSRRDMSLAVESGVKTKSSLTPPRN